MPGVGKTCHCAYITKLALSSGCKVYSNVPILGAIKFDKKDFGKYDFSGSSKYPSIILIDEGSLFYDGRNFSTNFNQESLEYLKLLRHRYNHVLIYSQSLDIDVKFIRMSNNIFQIKRSLIPFFTKLCIVRRKVDVDDNTHKFEDFYYKSSGLIGLFTAFRFFRPPLYKFFDSYSAPSLPKMIEIPYGGTPTK